MKKILPDGTVVAMIVSCMAFSCCDETVGASDIRTALKMPKGRASSSKSNANASTSEIVSEMKIMKQLLESIQMVSEESAVNINAMKKSTSKTEENVQKLADRHENNAVSFTATPDTSPALSYVNAYRKKAMAKANGTPIGTPNRMKRPRTESPSRPKVNYPEPKMGTKTNANGLSVVVQSNRNSDNKPKFQKALWVSRLNPATTNDDVIAYITSNTSVTDKARINVHKLVRKDVDLTTLKFVSFKVEMNAEDLDILNDSNLWPQHVQVREFMQTPQNVLGNYFPPLNAQDNNATSVAAAATTAKTTENSNENLIEMQ